MPHPATQPPSAEPPSATRYSLTAQALHWLTVLLLLAILPVAWVMASMPTNPNVGLYYTAHKSLGVTILLVTLARLAWRAAHPAPPLPGGTPRALELVGRANHWLLYALLVLMPLTGYVTSANGAPVSYFGLFDLPALPKNEARTELANDLHLLGRWAVYALVSLHVLGAAWHVAIRRDGLLSRIIPPQDDTARLPPR